MRGILAVEPNGSPILRLNGGEEEIRTPDRDNPITVFETAAFDRSATSPTPCKYTIFGETRQLKIGFVPQIVPQNS